MQDTQKKINYRRVFWGLGLFILSSSTVAFVTDPYVMADAGLVMVGIYLMVTGFKGHNVDPLD